MTSRARILKALKREKTALIPWIPLCSRTFFLSLPKYRKKFPLRWGEENGGLSEDFIKEELEFRVNFYREIGADFMQWGGGNACRIEMPHIRVQRKKKGNNLLVKYRTPIGELSQEFVFTYESQTLYNKDYLLKSVQDFPIYQYLIEDTVFRPQYRTAQNFLDIVGEDGVIFSDMADPPLQDWICDVLGTESIVFGLHDYKRKIDELVQLKDKRNLEYSKILAKSPLRIFLHQATWSIGRISPKIYKEYYSPYLKKYNEIMHRQGGICLDHASGERLNPYLRLIESVTLDGLYGLVFPSRPGDPKLSDICIHWKDKMTGMGGMDPHFLATANVNQIKEKTKRILEEVEPFSNFILGTADDVVYGTPVQNLEAISSVVRSFIR